MSVFIAPLFVHDKFWGFIGFDDCHHERIFSENEQAILRSGGLLIVNALLHNEMTQNIHAVASKLEAVIANYSGIIWCVDQNNIITLFNGTYLNELETTPSFFEGKNINEVLQDDKFLGIRTSVLKNFTEKADIQDMNLEFDGKTYRTRAKSIYDSSGNVVNVVGSVDDITERTKLQSELTAALEEAQTANHAKTSFLANMSHEMRTPLNAIIGLSELTLESEELSEEISSNLKKINSSGMTLLSTVNDILDISKIEAGKFDLVFSDYDLPSLINDTITQNILRIGKKTIKFILNINEDLPASLNGDELRVKQIFNNLLSNACKYTKKGTIELIINCERCEQEDDEDDLIWMTASIKDTGIGIKEKDLADLFDDYAQMDTRSNHTIEGTGLGLPITKRIVEMMNGSIGVKSKYGEGTTFTVKIQQKFVSNATIAAETVENLKNFSYSDSKRDHNLHLVRIPLPYARVLLVDDNITNLDVAKGMMKPYQMQIDCVTSGQQAIDAIRNTENTKYNAIFMDHMMPSMDGIEATRLIREIGTEYAKNIPIIACTANAVAGNEKMFLDKGFQAFISKPIEIFFLDEIIREWVQNGEQEKLFAAQHIGAAKQIPSDMQDNQEQAISDKSNHLIFNTKIVGLDIKKGIDRFGDIESFLKILRSFETNTRPFLETIATVDKDKLADYRIIVHGIKSSSRGICADLVGDKAEALENAAKFENFNFINDHNPAFLKIVWKLITDIENMLNKIYTENPKPQKDNIDKKLLLKLLTACKNYDMDGVDTAMAEVENYEYRLDNELAVWLQKNVDELNFAQIKEKLSALTDKFNQ
jgi:PAS domain S-box-containing protein